MKAFSPLITAGCLVVCAWHAASANPAPQQKPNIVVILADDFGYGSAGCYGADPRLVRTPAIDRIAAEGRRFTDGNTTSSVCSPTRYSLLTGRYCWRTSLKHEVLGTFSPLHIEPGRFNLASALKKHGYRTAAVGKWHLGYGRADESPDGRTNYKEDLSPGPLDLGFDYHFGVPSNHGDLTGVFVENRRVYGLRVEGIAAGMIQPGPDADSADFQSKYGPEDTENGKATAKIVELDAPRRKNQRVMKVLTDRASQWIEEQPRDKPFMLYFTPVAVHSPVTPDADLAGGSPAGAYGDWIHELDRSVGRILDTLDKTGRSGDTLVLFTSDNGGVFRPQNDRLPQTQAFKSGLVINGSLRGGKHDIWEGGFKVPFVARWPGWVPAGSVAHHTVSVVDILATVAEIVGEPLPASNSGAEDSRSFLGALLGKPDATGRADLITHSADGTYAIRQGPWKWIEGVPVDEITESARKSHQDQFRPQLYHTGRDPAEKQDVSAENPQIVANLRDLLRRYRDGGYSRELPPADVRPAIPRVAELPAITGPFLLDETLENPPATPWTISPGDWTPRLGGLWASPQNTQDKPAALRTPLTLGDGTLACEVAFKGANRVSLRFGTTDGSFRLVITRTSATLTKNPSRGEPASEVEDIASRQFSGLAAETWYPVRLTYRDDGVLIQINDIQIKARHPALGSKKTGIDFLVFGAGAGFRNVKVANR